MISDITTHVSAVRDALLGTAKARLNRSPERLVFVHILSGLLASKTAQVCGEIIKIGTEPENDIILVDEGVSTVHAELIIRETMFGTLVDICAHAPLRVGDKTKIGSGERLGLRHLPLRVFLGEVEILVDFENASPSAAPEPPFLLLKPQIAQQDPSATPIRASFTLALALFITGVGYKLSAASGADPGFFGQTSVHAPMTNIDLIQSHAVEQLNLHGLAQSVQIVTSQDGSLLVSGSVPAQLWSGWQSFRVWYDSQAGAPVLISDVHKADHSIALPPISAVRLSEPKEVFFSTGVSAKIGQDMGHGWVLTGIGNDAVLLNKAGVTQHIKY